MKIFRTFKRGVRDGFKSVIRNISLSLASIVSVSITLFIVSLALIITFNVTNFTKSIKEDVTMVIFLDKDVNKDRILEIEKEISSIKNVESLVFKSKEETKADLMKESDSFKTMLKDWDDENLPLKDSFMAKVSQLEKIGDTAKKITMIKGVSVVNYGETMVEKMLSVFSFVHKMMYLMVAILIIVTIFLIVNTIKLTIYSRKREIEIMRVVGASNFAIKFPFVVEGMILGFIGSLIPIFTTIFAYRHFYNKMSGVLFSNMIQLMRPSAILYTISLILLAIGVIVGMIGSSGAVRKYLTV